MDTQDFSYANLTNVKMLENLYELFLQDPHQIDPTWRHFFEGFELSFEQQTALLQVSFTGEARIFKLIEAYRTFGHLMASINPIRAKEMGEPRELSLETLNFKKEELTQLFPTYGVLEKSQATLQEIIEALKKIYCDTIGIEYMGYQSVALEKWIQKQIEPTFFKPNFTKKQKREILHQLYKSEAFETFLHTKYTGQKRFSLEGAETLIPLFSFIIEQGTTLGMEEFVIGMSHRGRLNLLANILNKPYSLIFSEFEDNPKEDELGAGGDVKYHKGFSADITTKAQIPVHVTLTANPSHLESVNAVVEGMVRARQSIRKDQERKKVIPILVHGDASLSGQGEVYECLQFYKLKGYSTGGTVHIIINNQIGFTTLPKEGRSTFYCTDISRTFSAPVFHVNAEDPEGCVYAASLALQIRQKFGCDVFIDLNCYRKYGHNEGDEPFFTQPIEYQLIGQKKTIREIYLKKLLEENAISHDQFEELEKELKATLSQALEEIKAESSVYIDSPLKGSWKGYIVPSEEDFFKKINTAVSVDFLKELAQKFCSIPKGFTPHPKIAKLFQERQEVVFSDQSKKCVDWGLAEYLAFGSLLCQNTPIRFSGQDCERGTFSHRHAVIVDQKTDEKYYPLKHLKTDQATFEIYNSPLSEFAVLGFEFGYSLSYPQSLTIWEAQFGDFANGSQVIIDQYLSCSEQKWARFSGLVLYLPHGYEGQGSEHSSARIERFLQLAADNNIQLIYPTTPAQLFHLLRRQCLRNFRRPLVVFTPKGLLRYAPSLSTLLDFSQETFKEVIAEDSFENEIVLFCSGRIYYDLLQQRQKRGIACAIVRIEQIYPWPKDQLMDVIDRSKNAKKFFWVQEEPINMGCWDFIKSFLQPLIPRELLVIARKRSAAPATGSHALHHRESEELMDNLFKGISA